jgi:uncharacterized Zn finger protein (UPF0148 family)
VFIFFYIDFNYFYKKGIKINDNIRKMADLLRSGNTMLNKACPVCNNPIFRNRNKENFCPTCNRNVLIVNDNSPQDEILKERETINNIKDKDLSKNQTELFTRLKLVLYENIDQITQNLKSTNQIQDIEAYSRILINYLDILSKISYFQKD